jgi:dUTP pyrophosphatase
MHVFKVKVNAETPEFIPVRVHPWDAGADLKSSEYHTLSPGEQHMYDTGVAIAIPPSFVGLVFNRSSQGKKGITIPNSVGVIDSEYRGNIKVLLRNDSNAHYTVNILDRIAQLVIVPIVVPVLEQYEGDPDDWNDTVRGTGGFGSTGQ